MKNVRKDQLKKCIVLEVKEFDNLLHQLFGDDIETDYSLDGLYIGYSNGDNLDTQELHDKLAEYFDVYQVTSIHIDDCDVLLVWIVYDDSKAKSKERPKEIVKKEYIQPSRKEKKEWKQYLYNALCFLATERPEFMPRKKDSLETLLDSFLSWANNYNDGYFTEKEEADTDRYCAWLVQEQMYENNHKQFLQEYDHPFDT